MYEKMNTALREAFSAKENGEIPVGCAIYYGDELIVKTHNTCEETGDPTCHAEMLAIKYAAKAIGREKLKKCDLFVTLEPCPMCAGAMIHSNLNSVYFGAYDKDFGAYEGFVNLFSHSYAKKIDVYGGIMEEECTEIIKQFFMEMRTNKDK